ncbi:MAG: right-handed parallel beta-helix repeat-containing protein [Candidatus Eremiobacteraeota bacterium]|nr:right-handed parallel beta-helix repeat-containing protein [Candidatus Eremiobacteraeota bacterium]
MAKKVERVTLQGELTDEDLLGAIERLESGGTVRIEGVVRLTRQVQIRKAVHLEGSHRDASWIVGEGLGYGLVFKSKGERSLRGLSVAECGVKVHGGRFQASRCRFSHHSGGSGLKIQGDARGRISRCEARGNFQGIVLGGASDMLVTFNRCQENTDGIVFQDKARGAALKNDCQDNLGHSIWVMGLARPILDEDFRPSETAAPRPRKVAAPAPEEDDPFEELIARGIQDGTVSLDDIREAFNAYSLPPEVFDSLVERLAEEGIEVEPEED